MCVCMCVLQFSFSTLRLKIIQVPKDYTYKMQVGLSIPSSAAHEVPPL